MAGWVFNSLRSTDCANKRLFASLLRGNALNGWSGIRRHHVQAYSQFNDKTNHAFKTLRSTFARTRWPGVRTSPVGHSISARGERLADGIVLSNNKTIISSLTCLFLPSCNPLRNVTKQPLKYISRLAHSSRQLRIAVDHTFVELAVLPCVSSHKAPEQSRNRTGRGKTHKTLGCVVERLQMRIFRFTPSVARSTDVSRDQARAGFPFCRN